MIKLSTSLPFNLSRNFAILTVVYFGKKSSNLIHQKPQSVKTNPKPNGTSPMSDTQYPLIMDVASPPVHNPDEIKSILEAVLFAASEPISLEQFGQLFDDVSTWQIRQQLMQLRDEYQEMQIAAFNSLRLPTDFRSAHTPSIIRGLKNFTRARSVSNSRLPLWKPSLSSPINSP